MNWSKAHVWALLGYDVVVELLTGRKGAVCGDDLLSRGSFVCERRANHHGQHAMVTDKIAARWGRR